MSNHAVLYGKKPIRDITLRNALWEWDDAVRAAEQRRLFVAPSLWVGSQAAYEGGKPTTSAKYKYPLGSAQIMLALLEAVGRAPKFYDRTFLPWLIANCDGGADSHREYAFNTNVWWPAMAAIVGPSSLTERIFDRVDTMRPHDLRSVINGLSRERAAERKPQVLRDNWSLPGVEIPQLQEALRWLTELAVWPDPVLGGTDSMSEWVPTPVSGSGLIYINTPPPARKSPQPVSAINAKADPQAAAASIKEAEQAINANFYTGGISDSRFNWVGNW